MFKATLDQFLVTGQLEAKAESRAAEASSRGRRGAAGPMGCVHVHKSTYSACAHG